jgi:hypothetical protein
MSLRRLRSGRPICGSGARHSLTSTVRLRPAPVLVSQATSAWNLTPVSSSETTHSRAAAAWSWAEPTNDREGQASTETGYRGDDLTKYHPSPAVTGTCYILESSDNRGYRER